MTGLAQLAAVVIVAGGVFGLLIGSFLNVVVYRVPAGMSVISPASACPKCGRSIRGFDNVPVLSWLVLRGKCRDCREPIAARYPAVELGTGLLFVGVAWWFVASLPAGSAPVGVGVPELIAFLYLAAISIALSLIDIDVKKLPNTIVLPSYIVAALLLTVTSIVSGDYGALIRAGIAMAALVVFYFLLAFFYPGGMGFGDVKLAGVLGLYLGYLGWTNLIVGVFAAFLLGGLFAIGLIIFRRAQRKTAIPFGPWMLAGAWIGILFGGTIGTAYLSLVGLT